MIDLLRKIKAFPYLRQSFFFFYYYFYKTRRIISGKDNEIQIDIQGSLPILQNVVFKINGNENTIIVRHGVTISDTKIEIQGHRNQLVIEEYCHIKGSYLWMEDYDCKLTIGKGTTFEKEVKVCVSEPKSAITIGEGCMFAYGLVIRCGDSHSIIDLDSNERINYAEDINIGNHVWIGTNAQVLKGVRIGSNSIVAAGAIVTKDIPENCIAAGIPAQVKRTRVKWLREKILRKSVEID